MMPPKIISDILSWLRRPSERIVGTSPERIFQERLGIGQPIVDADSLSGYRDRQETAADIKALLEHIHVRRNLEAVERMTFSGWGFKVIPPEDFNGTNQKAAEIEKELTNKLWEFNKLWKIDTKIAMTFENIKGYRWDLHEIYMGQIGKWIVPVYWSTLPPHSFAKSVSGYEGSSGYMIDRLLKGIIYSKKDNNYLFYQAQDLTGEPVRIPTENVFYIVDPRVSDPLGHSYLSGLVPTIKSHNLGRMSLNQTLARGGSPNMVVKVNRTPTTDDDAGYAETQADENGNSEEDMGTKEYAWWKYAHDLSRRQGKDTRLVIPEEIDLQWPDLKVAINPIEADHYFIQEIVDALVPVDPLKQMGTSLAKSSKELLDYLQEIFGGYQDMVGTPYAELLTYIININGFNGWAIENVWKTLSPKDDRNQKDHSLKSYQAGSITVTRYYQETGRPAPTNDELITLYREQLIKAGKPELLSMITPDVLGIGKLQAQSNIEEGLQVFQDAKAVQLISLLKELGYFDANNETMLS